MTADLTALGAKLIAISPELAEHTAPLVKRHRLGFPILVDRDNAAAKALRLEHGFSDALREVYAGFGLDLPAVNAGGGWHLPLPARYVVGTDGAVHSAAVNADYKQRPEPAATVEDVRRLVNG